MNATKQERQRKPPPTAPPPTAPAHFRITEEGLYRTEITKEGDPKEHWISPPIYIDARTHDSVGENYGHYVRFRNVDNHERSTILLFQDLVEGTEAIQKLFSMGFRANNRRDHLGALKRYILESNPPYTICTMPSHGWHGDAFVDTDKFELNGEPMKEILILDPAIAAGHRYHTAGTLEEWQQNVSRPCSGNSRPVFAINSAFAPPLLYMVKAPNIGAHFRGVSSIGKTTVLYAAGSVWGGGGADNNLGFVESWRTTANGLELQCAMHNDALLCLDEISLVNEKEVGEIIYCLGNGVGKRRATRDIKSRPVIQFRLVFISCGERSLRDIMQCAGKQTKGGQEARLIDIPADVGYEHGIFERLPDGFKNGAELSKALTEASKTFYGTPSRTFIRYLATNFDRAAERAKELRDRFVQRLDLEKHHASGEIYRIANSMGLIAAAGEMATELGITGWEEGDAESATIQCFQAWHEERGGSYAPDDVRAGVRAVAAFLSRFPARFQSLDDDDQHMVIHDRAGLYEDDPENRGRRIYYINRHVFNGEICRGDDYRLVLEELQKHEYLVADSDGKHTTVKKYIKGEGHDRFYAVRSTIYENDDFLP